MVQFNSQKTICLTPEAKYVTPGDLYQMRHPILGSRHVPTPFYDLSMYIVDSCDRTFGHLGEGSAELVVNKTKTGHHLLGKVRFPGDDGISRLVAFRSSDNMDFATTVSGGGEVFMCANGMMLTSGTKDVRKNTRNAWGDFVEIVDNLLGRHDESFARIQEDARALKGIPCTERRGAELIGLAQYQGILTDTQANIARKEHRLPGSTLAKLDDGSQDPRVALWQSDEGFGERTAWSLYNACTEGLKKGSPAGVITRHTKVHDWMMSQAA